MGSMREQTQQLRSTKGQQQEANAVNANINVSISQQLASKHCIEDGRGNVVTLAGGRRNQSRQWKAQQGLE